MKRLFAALFIFVFVLSAAGCGDVKQTALDGLSQEEALHPGVIIINEAMSDNTDYAKCADGRYYDWIELYNSSDVRVVLTNCFLTDDRNAPDKWMIPSLTLEAHEYAVVYMSDRDCTDSGELHTSFKLSADGDSVMLYAPDFTLLAEMDIPPAEENLSYGVGEDGSPGWFEIPSPNAANGGNFSDTIEGLGIGKAEILINEYMANNTKIIYDADGDYSDWIELYNPTDSDILLDGYSLCDSSVIDGRWYFPQGTVIKSKDYLLVYCSGKDKTDSQGYLHTSFGLSVEDDGISLVTPMGYTNTFAPMLQLDKNVSAVLTDEGEYMRCSMPTPERKNSTAVY